MKSGEIVNTPYGRGVLIKKDNIQDPRLERWLVKIETFDMVPDTYKAGLKSLHDHQGGLYFFRTEMWKEA